MSIEQLFPGYEYKTYSMARYVVECEDGVVRELSPDCPLFKELQAHSKKMLESSLQQIFAR